MRSRPRASILYFNGQREGQFDFGWWTASAASRPACSRSFKHVTLAGNQTGGTLGQAAFTLDYMFKWGKVGVFGTKAFLDNALINSQAAVLAERHRFPDLFKQRYLRVVNQAGVSSRPVCGATTTSKAISDI